MNWTVFWTLLIGTVAGMVILLGWLKVGMMLAPKMGENAAMAVTLGTVLVAISALFGMIK